MSRDFMDYSGMVESALRGVVREAIARAAASGLPGDHHFYITFKTGYPGVKIPEFLRTQYPEEMTIVLQHQYSGLAVQADAFVVTLSFNKVPERLVVPFAAISAFTDPSVQFGLQFRVGKGEADAPATDRPEAAAPAALPAKPAAKSDAEKPAGEVVALDAFRKK